MYSEFKNISTYKIGDIVLYNSILYKFIKVHKRGDNFNYDDVVELTFTYSDFMHTLYEKRLSVLSNELDYTVSKGYINDNGVLEGILNDKSSNALCKYIRFLCKPNEVFYYTGVGRNNAISCIFYNDDKILSTFKTENIVYDYSITIPEGCNNVLFQSFEYAIEVDTLTEDDIRFNILTIEHLKSNIINEVIGVDLI